MAHHKIGTVQEATGNTVEVDGVEQPEYVNLDGYFVMTLGEELEGATEVERPQLAPTFAGQDASLHRYYKFTTEAEANAALGIEEAQEGS